MEEIKIAFLGDIMPGEMLSGKTDGYISDPLLSYLNSFDTNKLWQPISRIGMEVGISLLTQINADYKLTYLSLSLRKLYKKNTP